MAPIFVSSTQRPRVGHPGVGVRPTWELWAFGLLAAFFVGFGVEVLHRSAFSDRRRTDAGVYFRAGYAARTGTDPYSVSDDNQWRFLYPPGIAAFFAPLADPPSGAAENGPSARSMVERPRGYLPYPVSVVLWYALSVACVGASIELLARTLTRASPDPLVRAMDRRSGGWWTMRFWPLLMCLPDIGSTLSRGQINLVVLAMICAGIAWLSSGRKILGGAAFAAAACVKIIPGLLVLDVAARRGVRAILGCAACGLALLVVLPALVFGPTRAWDYTLNFSQHVLLAGVLGSPERLQAGADFADTDNLSIQGSLHNALNMNIPRARRPSQPSSWIRVVHIAAALLLTGATLLVGRKPWSQPKREDAPMEITLRIGMLSSVMVMTAPMAHRHYFVFLLPAVFALVFLDLMRSRIAAPHGIGAVLVVLYPIALSLPRLPWLERWGARDWPIPLGVTLAVWGLSAWTLARLSSGELSESTSIDHAAA